MRSLEYWIADIINLNLQVDDAFRKFMGKYFIHCPSRAALECYQLYRLNLALRHCRENSPFYREVFQAAGAPGGDIADLGKLSEFPLTSPQELAENPLRFLCTSQAEIARPCTFITSGTTGPRKKIFWTQGDLERITSFMAAGIGTVADPGDTILILLPDGKPNSQADLLRQGIEKLGAVPIVADPDLTPQDFLKCLDSVPPRVIFGYTRKIYRLSKALASQADLRQVGVRYLFLASEYLPYPMREQLKRLWGCEIRTHYGLTEMGLGVAVECEAQDGFHFNEADLLVEIVHLATGKPVPVGEEGELVFTTLNREAMPLVRYRTHDLGRLIPGPCACGSTSLLKIDHVKKRMGNILHAADGGEIYPALFDEALFHVPDIVDYQLILKRAGEKDQLHFKVETIADSPEIVQHAMDQLLSMPLLQKNMALKTMAPPTIEIVPWGALSSLGRAKKMILDER